MTKRLAFMLAASLGIGGLGACAGSATGTAYGGGGYAAVTVRSPELVTVEDDLYVLADADEPVFYTDDYYWLYRDNRWYRSRSYDRDWVYVSSPSQRVRRIHEPTAYVRYRSRHQEARTRPAPARDPWREEYDRQDAPRNLPPREQQPLQPTQPQQPAQPYPRPPQQEPVRDHGAPVDRRIDTPIQRTPPRARPTTPPGQDIRPTPPGHDNRPATPPGQDRDRGREDRARAEHPPAATPPARADRGRDDRGRDERGREDRGRDEDRDRDKPDKSDKRDKRDR